MVSLCKLYSYHILLCFLKLLFQPNTLKQCRILLADLVQMWAPRVRIWHHLPLSKYQCHKGYLTLTIFLRIWKRTSSSNPDYSVVRPHSFFLLHTTYEEKKSGLPETNFVSTLGVIRLHNVIFNTLEFPRVKVEIPPVLD